jgi:hypothetical protein
MCRQHSKELKALKGKYEHRETKIPEAHAGGFAGR